MVYYAFLFVVLLFEAVELGAHSLVEEERMRAAGWMRR